MLYERKGKRERHQWQQHLLLLLLLLLLQGTMVAERDARLPGVLLALLCFCCSPGKALDTPGWTGVENVVSRRGDTAVLRCYLMDGVSRGAWLNRSSIIFVGQDKWTVDPRVSVLSSTGSKHEYSLQVQKVDLADDGPYTCSVQSRHNSQSSHFYLSVKVPPKIYDISSDISVTEGSNVSLSCLASGKPEPTISWRHVTPLAKKYEIGESLLITSITRDQAGDYECSAQNDISFPDTKTVRVTVDFPPKIYEMKFTVAGLGSKALLRCEAAAVPSPVFEWYKGKKRITKGHGIEIKNFGSRSVLSVANMTEDRYDNYTCMAVNKLGSANASIPLLPPNTAPYGTTGSAHLLSSCPYLVWALSYTLSRY